MDPNCPLSTVCWGRWWGPSLYKGPRSAFFANCIEENGVNFGVPRLGTISQIYKYSLFPKGGGAG